MASIKKKSSGGGGGANWMDTYGDMVTLLLCFFVLLYSISTIDQTKFMIIMQSFNRNALVSPDDNPVGPTDNSENKSGGSGLPSTTDEIQDALDDLYEYLAQYSASRGEGDIMVSKGDGYVFISFADAIFFDGDSSFLRKDGQELLDGIIPALRACGSAIDELEILGHTAQVVADKPNPVPGDRRLASLRATEVAIYLQENMEDVLNPGRIVPKGLGQWRNVAPHDGVEANRAKNRRVEMIITGRDLEDQLSDSYEKYYTMYNATKEQTTVN